MAPKLTVQNAEIKTAAVELKTLTVSGKQVTLAVFRQLREEPLIAEDGTLNGVPWGTVNYHPDKCGDAPEHVHVVWQRGSELLRTAVEATDFKPFGSTNGDCFLMACVWEHLNGGTEHFNGQPLVKDKRGDGHHYSNGRYIELSGMPVCLIASPEAAAAVTHYTTASRIRNKPNGESYQQMQLDQAERQLGFARDELADQIAQVKGTASELYAALKSECAIEAERRKRHADAREVIADLPQLFIAV